MTDVATVVSNQESLQPIVAIVSPYLDVVVKALIGLAVTILTAKAYQWFGIKATVSQEAQITSAAQNVAGVIVAKADATIANRSVTVNSPELKNAIDSLVASSPKILDKLGITPDSFSHKVAGELGKMQVVMNATTPTPPVIALVPTTVEGPKP